MLEKRNYRVEYSAVVKIRIEMPDRSVRNSEGQKRERNNPDTSHWENPTYGPFPLHRMETGRRLWSQWSQRVHSKC